MLRQINFYLNKNLSINYGSPPGPGDESLSLGAVYSYLYDTFGYKKCLQYIKPLKNAYLGPNISKSSIDSFKKNKLIKNFKLISDKNYDHVAKFLQKGEIIFVCIEGRNLGKELWDIGQ